MTGVQTCALPIWALEKENIKPKIQPKRKKKKKKKLKKGEKQAPKDPGIVEKLVNRFLRYGSKKKLLPGDRLFDFFQSQFLTVSAKLGLLGDLNSIGVAGDGTPLETSRYPRSKSICDCSAQGITKCNHPRLYSQPDCNSGWDSSRVPGPAQTLALLFIPAGTHLAGYYLSCQDGSPCVGLSDANGGKGRLRIMEACYTSCGPRSEKRVAADKGGTWADSQAIG